MSEKTPVLHTDVDGLSHIDRSAAAQEFIAEQIKTLSDQHPSGMRFTAGVLWTAFLTADGDVCGGEDPQHLVRQINAHGLPLYMDHDPSLPVGWTFSAGVFRDDSNAEAFIAAVYGIYDFPSTATFRETFSTPAMRRIGHVDVVVPVDLEFPCVDIRVHHRELDIAPLHEILETGPPAVHREPLLEYRHSDSASVAMLTVAIALPFVVWNPFVAELMGQAARDAYPVIKDWVSTKLTDFFGLQKVENPIFEIESQYRGCRIRMVVKSRVQKTTNVAYLRCGEAAREACKLIEVGRQGGLVFHEVVYVFDVTTESWALSHALQINGQILADRKDQFEYGDLPRFLSLGGTYGRGERMLKQGLRYRHLEELLTSIFTPEELSRFLRHFHPLGTTVLTSVPQNAPPAEFVHQIVQSLRRHGALNTEFFESMKLERPARQRDIDEVGVLWLVEGESTRGQVEPIDR